MKILIVGSNGQLGSCIREICNQEEYSDMEFVFVDFPEFDLRKKNIVESFFLSNKFDVIVNCAAYTAVDKAEEDVENAFLINADAVGLLAQEAAEQNADFIHVSTDYVFDGKSVRPYTENDPINPINIYGKSKLAGEDLAMKHNPHSYIIRTSWLYSAYGANFVKSMRRLFKEKDTLSIVDDQEGCPTSAHDLAKLILEIIHQNNKQYGVYHFSNTDKTSWFKFAQEIAKLSYSNIKLTPIKTEEYPTLASRPAYSVMNCGKIENTFQIKIRPWRQALKDVIIALNHSENGNSK